MADNEEYMLTTVDNPWDPYTQYPEWYAYDQEKGYDTAGMLARIANFSVDQSDADQSLAICQAIDEIVKENVLGIYKKAMKPES